MGIDITRAPLGQIVASRLVEASAAGDDRLERHYLEIKSDLDLTKKTDLTKIAKYILGSANRLPDVARTAFEGYGVMIIGVAPGDIRGVPPIEVLDISKIVGRYLGAAGPKWDIVRVPVEGSTSEVIVVVVDPPREGQKPFACRKDGDGLVDGRIYIRADGETREAKGDELDRLIERAAAAPQLEVAFEVGLVGHAFPVAVDDAATLEEHVNRTTQVLVDALPQPEPDPNPDLEPEIVEDAPTDLSLGFTSGSAVPGIASAKLAAMIQSQTGVIAKAAELSKGYQSAFSALTKSEPEKRTEEQYRSSIQSWERRFRGQWPGAVDALVGRLLEPISIRVKNQTKTFFHDVELKIHLDGVVRGVEYFDDERIGLADLDLADPPRIWGPVVRSIIDPLQLRSSAYVPTDFVPSTYRSPLDWNNSGSVDLRLDIGELRPREEYVFSGEELVLVLPADHNVPVKGTWEITARDHNEIYSGQLEVEVGEVNDFTAVLQKLLKLQ